MCGKQLLENANRALAEAKLSVLNSKKWFCIPYSSFRRLKKNTAAPNSPPRQPTCPKWQLYIEFIEKIKSRLTFRAPRASESTEKKGARHASKVNRNDKKVTKIKSTVKTKTWRRNKISLPLDFFAP